MKSEQDDTAVNIQQVDIAIAGGGLVGLTLAVLLSHEIPDISIAVIDPKQLDATAKDRATENIDQQSIDHHSTEPDEKRDERTTALSKGSVLIFKALGLWPQVAPFATPIKQVDVSDKGHVGRTHYPSNQDSVDTNCTSSDSTNSNTKSSLGYVVQNHALGQALLLAAQKSTAISLFAKSHVKSFTPKSSGCVIDYQVNSNAVCQLHAQCLIVADGAQSSLRSVLGIDTFSYDYKQHAIITTLTHSKPHQGVAYERFTQNGPMALLPYGGGVHARQSALVWTRSVDAFEQAFNLNDRAFLSQIQAQFGYRLGQFEHVGMRSHYPLHLVLAKEQVRSSLVVLGNAAHFLHPVAGQGFNLSLRDCASLSVVFRNAFDQKVPLGLLSVLEQYQSMQALDQKATIALSDKFTQLFSHSSPVIQFARNMGLLAMQKAPKVQSAFFNHMMGQGFKRAALRCERAYNRQQNYII